MTPEGRPGRTLRVLVAGESGRPVSAHGLAEWLAGVAPARARGSVGVALVGDSRVRALNKQFRKRNYPTDVLSFPASARTDTERATARQASADRTDTQRAKAGRASATRSDTKQGTARKAPATRQFVLRDSSEYLGDIVIARGVARRQARARGHSEKTEIRILALHGLLHLLGYDHERDDGGMARVERRLRRKGGLREGLIERESDL